MHKITVEQVDDGRVIVSVNGYEIDILADEDGLCATLQKDAIVHSEIAIDWNEPHINA